VIQWHEIELDNVSDASLDGIWLECIRVPGFDLYLVSASLFRSCQVQSQLTVYVTAAALLDVVGVDETVGVDCPKVILRNPSANSANEMGIDSRAIVVLSRRIG
jgi:hypothetical protein